MSLTAYEDTLFHIELIQRKREKLHEAQLDAERQVLHRIGRDCVAGVLTEDDLVELYRRYRDLVAHLKRPGIAKLWDEAIPCPIKKIRYRVHYQWVAERCEPNDGTGWSGESPLEPRAQRPPDGQAVVYVLFDHENVPCYVGSTEKFKARIDAHGRDKAKPFVRWAAYPCDDREAAYQLEDRLLKEHKPYLNRKASR